MKYVKGYIEFINESNEGMSVFFHGTSSRLPFREFASAFSQHNAGINNSFRTDYGGYFFTSEKENAEFFTDYWVCKVEVDSSLIHPNPLDDKHSPTVLQQAKRDKKIYLINDYHDGAMPSDILVVPYMWADEVKIVEWIFVGDEGSYFETLDEIFLGEPWEDEETGEEVYAERSWDSIESTLGMMEFEQEEIDMLCELDIFQKYVNQ